MPKQGGKNLRDSVKAALILGALIVFAASCLQQTKQPDVAITATEMQQPMTTRISDGTFKTFSHTVPEHDQMECNSCHQREGASVDKYAGHGSCIGCHMAEFTNNKTQVCGVCHNDLKSVPMVMKPFPTKFIEGFNMKFDHDAHTRGEGLPREGCSACHRPAGASQSIPVGIRAHANCLSCHTPESSIGSCGTCHSIAPYSRTPATSVVIKAVFSHADHTSGQGVNCMECHGVRASGAQGRQVTTLSAVQHTSAGNGVSCRTCHNDRRAFGEANFSNCARCHTGSGFDMLP